MPELTAEQQIRQVITGNPMQEPNFQHEGENVVRWLKGGTLPPAWVTFHDEGPEILVKCAGCQNVLGYLPSNFNPEPTTRELARIRLSGHENHMPEGWPAMNIISAKSY